MKKLSAILFLFWAGFFLFATERLIVNNIEVKDFINSTDILGDGTVYIAIENNHSKITKWGLYCDNNIEISGGSLTVCMSGKNSGGALMMDKKGVLTLAQGAALYESNSEPGGLVKTLTWSKGLSKESKRYVKIVEN